MTDNVQFKEDTRKISANIQHYQRKWGRDFGKDFSDKLRNVEDMLDLILTILNTDEENKEKERIKCLC
jgi:hypothetical protein